MLQQGNGTISGEVYWVPEPCWPALDDWEDVPEVYQRSSATLRDGRSVWLYEGAQEQRHLALSRNQRLAVE